MMIEFDEAVLDQLIEELSLTEDIAISEIPDIELYMEQLTTFMESKLESQVNGTPEKVLTKTMINNYTKAGIVMPPVNKKYTKRHIILLILIYNLKNILSIKDIKSLFGPVLNNIATPDDDLITLEEIYTTFLDVKNVELACFRQGLAEKANMIKAKTEASDNAGKKTAELFLIVIMLVAQADAHKKLAEKIIEKYF
ncbi:DUF1836 domain-containing protein [Dehalobacter sp. TBBPA1]|uniref:DUF1836 domain-containing protein n=1 Tax=Dehalobacter sp. TBBPA1 TaxID=3235037 RepID=UPI0034A1725A